MLMKETPKIPELRKPAWCPKCGSQDIREIVYGLPTDEAFELAEAGEVVLGGCFITFNDPDWCCMQCQHKWSDDSDPARKERDRIIFDLLSKTPKKPERQQE